MTIYILYREDDEGYRETIQVYASEEQAESEATRLRVAERSYTWDVDDRTVIGA